MEYISKLVTPDELPFNGMFVISSDDGSLLIADRPDWVRDPMTGQRVYIDQMWISELDVKCPICGLTGHHGFITFRESEKFVIACTGCKNFIWARVTS